MLWGFGAGAGVYLPRSWPIVQLERGDLRRRARSLGGRRRRPSESPTACRYSTTQARRCCWPKAAPRRRWRRPTPTPRATPASSNLAVQRRGARYKAGPSTGSGRARRRSRGRGGARGWRAAGAPRRTSAGRCGCSARLERRATGSTHLREAVAVLEGSPARLEHAKALAALGRALRAAAGPTEAREPLRRALELADACGAERARARRPAPSCAPAGARPRRDGAQRRRVADPERAARGRAWPPTG